MNYSEPKLVKMDPFKVSGLSVRTINSDEFNSATAKLPGLWERFYSLDLMKQQDLNTPIWGVYSDYDSDMNGYYTVTAGLSSDETLLHPEFNTISIQTEDYLVFEGEGPMPKAVIETWQCVWDYFAKNKKYKRCYKTDFECYKGNHIAIYIGVIP